MIMTVSDKLTKGLVGTIVAVCSAVFIIFLFLDDRYFHTSAAEQMVSSHKASDEQLEIKIAGALNEQMKMQQKFYTDQQKVNDMRQLDQLRTSKALLETEIRRSPNDRLLREKLGIIDGQIRTLEGKLLNQ
jgi:ABC-type protease/lipase transport system fused ATPase/permease subunit